MLVNILFSVGLLLVAFVLAWQCESSWRSQRQRDIEDEEREFYRRRRRRRLGVVGIIILMAIAIPLSALIGSALAAEVYLLALAVGLVIMFLLALLDLIASQAYFAREKEKFSTVRDELEADLQRIREQKGPSNGQP